VVRPTLAVSPHLDENAQTVPAGVTSAGLLSGVLPGLLQAGFVARRMDTATTGGSA
jgi:hypothetical protein